MVTKDSGTIDNAPPPQENAVEEIKRELAEIAHTLNEKPFKPHPALTSGHAQTLGAYVWPRRITLRAHRKDVERFFETEPNVRLLAYCRWQEHRLDAPTMLVVHGLEGSSTSIYMLGAADKAFRAGFNVIRLNMRNCGGTEHLTETLYHSGMSGDFRACINELIEQDGLKRIFLVGFSMSGNIALKYAGEEGEDAPRELAGICVVSPSVDLHASANEIERRANWIYHQRFMASLRKRIRQKKRFYPELYDTRGLSRVRKLRQFDNRYTSIHGGFKDADDYYTRASSLSLIRDIRIPTLIIHAQDDPFIPFHPLRDASIKENPYVLLLAPEHGGHVGFLSDGATGAEDRFWAENRVVQFCKLLDEKISH
ncbi:MAG: alpha/beta fold hydrolase [Pyrinomonadaceae bacterium]